jgi:protease-4
MTSLLAYLPVLTLHWTLAAQTIIAPPDWDRLPNEVTGAARGVLAAAIDPAGAGILQGSELQVRQQGTTQVAGTGAWGLYAGTSIGRLSLVTGYSWSNVPRAQATRSLLGASLKLGHRLRVGADVMRLQPKVSLSTRTVVNAGLIVMPHPVLSVSLGVDALNAPTWPRRAHMRRAPRIGLALRPFAGDPWLTLAADTRMTWADGPHWPDTHAMVDYMPYEGLHLFASFRRTPLQQTAWAGFSVDWGGLEALGAGRAHGGEQNPSFADRTAWALSYRSQPHAPLPLRQRKHLHLDVSGDLLATGNTMWSGPEATVMLPARLAALATRSDVAQVTLDIGALSVGLATVEELRQAIFALRAQHIRVVAHLTAGDTQAYLVAAAADRITMDAVGTLDVRGFALESHYLADTLARFGVRVDAVAVGEYKNGPDRLTRNTPTQADLQVQQSLVDASYNRLLDVLQTDRKLGPTQAHAALGAGPLGARSAYAHKLIDGIDPAIGDNRPRPPAHLRLGAHTLAQPNPRWGATPRVVVVPITGTLLTESDAPWLPGAKVNSAVICQALAHAGHNPDVAGVVIRIDSPGGDVVAAEQVYRSVRALAQRKPVAVSMADVAASGGYYAAMGAPMIFAQPSTLTGSIGIYSIKPDISGLLAQWGVHTQRTQSGERAHWDDYQGPLTEPDRARLGVHLNELYSIFMDRVADGRHLTAKRVAELAQGRVYTGAVAQSLGLVDALGGMSDAIAWVKRKAALPEDAVVAIDVPKRTQPLAAWLGQKAMVQGDVTPKLPWELLTRTMLDPTEFTRQLQAVEATHWALLPWSPVWTAHGRSRLQEQ